MSDAYENPYEASGSPVAKITESADRIPFGQKCAYASGMLVNNLQAAAIPAMMVVLNLGLGMDPVLVGIIGFLPRIFDAVSDPMLGYISDNTRTRWGRRRPFIFAGSLVAGIVFAGMWQAPSGMSENYYFWFFLIAQISYFLTYTVFATPLVAFGYEMTPDYHERTRLHAFANAVGQLAWIGAPWIWAVMASYDDKVTGASVLGYVFGGTIMVLGVVPAIFCRERVAPAAAEDTGVGLSAVMSNLSQFFSSLLTTLKCKPFVKLCAATFLVFNGYQLGVSFALYVMIYYLFGGQDSPAGELNGWWGSLTAVCTIVVIPITAFLSQHLGKRTTFMVTISLSMFGYAIKWVGYNPDAPYLLLISCPFVAFGTGSLFTLMGSMISDVCDYDELHSNQRREGVFGAIYWWMVKVGMALALLLTGYLLDFSGFITPSAPPAEAAESAAPSEDDSESDSPPEEDAGPVVQSEETMLWLRLFDVVIPIVTSAIALGIMWSYEISESKAQEIRQQLEQRRGRLGGSPD